MQSTDEKKPPSGGVLDYRLLGQRNRILGRLLAARAELNAASFVAADARLGDAFDRIDAFVAGELDALVREVIPLLEREPANPFPPGTLVGGVPVHRPARSALG